MSSSTGRGNVDLSVYGAIEWTRRHMPVLSAVGRRFAETKPFDGMIIGFRLHLEPKTAVLIETLQAGGASVVAMGNDGTTQFDTAEYLAAGGATILDRPTDGSTETAANLAEIAGRRPDLVLDNGAELIVQCLENDHAPRGATEETTSGATLLREQFAGAVGFPVIVINDSPLKSIVENKHGVGESVVDTIVRSTNVSLHRKRVVVFGYGWCGRGIALYARHRGADVTVVELDPIKALEAAMDGFDTDSAEGACSRASFVITATGRDGVVPFALIETMPDGVILANAGHVDTEIDLPGLEHQAEPVAMGPSIERYDVADGRSVFVIAEGKIVNLAADGGKGNPIEAMDLGLTLQALSLEQLALLANRLESGPQPIPDAINAEVAEAMLRAMGGRI